MTIQQAIENRERCLEYLIGCGPSATEDNVEAVRLSIVALKEKAAREDPRPLTYAELKQMEGVPVWIVWPDNRIEAKWWLPGSLEWGVMEFDDFIMERYYGKTWIAYRHKPKEVQL